MQRILIVSGDDLLRDLIRLSLTGLDAEVRSARTVRETEILCGRIRFDLIILLGMAPFFRLRFLLRQMRPRGLRRPLLYVVSWQQSEQAVLSLLECGIDQYMTFPINLQRLRTKVGRELMLA